MAWYIAFLTLQRHLHREVFLQWCILSHCVHAPLYSFSCRVYAEIINLIVKEIFTLMMNVFELLSLFRFGVAVTVAGHCGRGLCGYPGIQPSCFASSLAKWYHQRLARNTTVWKSSCGKPTFSQDKSLLQVLFYIHSWCYLTIVYYCVHLFTWMHLCLWLPWK